MSKRRKNSIDTNASSTSYTSSNYSFIEKNEKGDNEIKKEDQNIMDYSTNLQTYKNNKNDRISHRFVQNKNDCNDDGKKNENNSMVMYNQEKKDYDINPEFENTEILRVEVKLAKDKKGIFKLKRYDDVFETIKTFCEINTIDEKLIKPLIIKSLQTINTIYQIMNSKISRKQYTLLKAIQKKE